MQGIVHPYYTVALAPGVAALVAVGGAALWQRRAQLEARIGLAVMIAATGIWSYALLARHDEWHPALRFAVLAVTLASALAVLVTGVLTGVQLAARWAQRLLAGALAAGMLAGLGGTAAYAVATAGQPHTGSIPSVGPAAGAGSGSGGPGGAATSGTALAALLRSTTTRWAAAAIGSQGAGSAQLASGRAVMSIGGFNGGDPAPALAQFQQYVASGKISYFISGGGGVGGGPGAGRGGSSAITTWVQANFTASTVSGQTVYDLRRHSS